MWCTWQLGADDRLRTCWDQRQPGSNTARPTANSPSSTSSMRAFSTVRTSSGRSKRLRRSCMEPIVRIDATSALPRRSAWLIVEEGERIHGEERRDGQVVVG